MCSVTIACCICRAVSPCVVFAQEALRLAEKSESESPRRDGPLAFVEDVSDDEDGRNPPTTIRGLKARVEEYALRNMMPVLGSIKGKKQRKLFMDAMQAVEQRLEGSETCHQDGVSRKSGAMFFVLNEGQGNASEQQKSARKAEPRKRIQSGTGNAGRRNRSAVAGRGGRAGSSQ